ncbi:MAG: M1 family metallopeptidase [Flavobacteriales bacterium]|nr:M1 family metallopeptidase [Flavobacteriales bacterium]
MRNILPFLLLLPLLSPAQSNWQQQADHEMQVVLDDEGHILRAFQTVTYTNNSPDTLRFIWFHLWPNAYQRKTALDRQMRESGDMTLFYSKMEDRGFIDSLDWRSEGVPINSEKHPKHSDITKLVLNEPLLPGQSIRITTPFRVQIPKGIFSRLGHLGQAYQITQWFPKPAVYDHNGWHPIPYLGQGEFFSEFGTYDVHITLPKNYVVGATGDLVNGEQELQWLDEKVRKTEAIDTFNLRDLSFPSSEKEMKTLHFHQENVHDFAWFADKRYHVLKGEVEMPSGRKVKTWAMFTNNEADLWKRAIEYLNDATRFYSDKVGEYPYNHVTAVDGVLSEGGGMEYPNITIIGESGNAYSLEETIMHEAGHNWFYGMLASNERQHPWMDEGMNSFIESRYMKWKYPGLKLRETLFDGGLYRLGMKLLGAYRLEHSDLGLLAYRMSARMNTDQPMELPSTEFSPTNYGTVAYMKSAAVLNYLMQYLGEKQMDSLMHRYFYEWQFRHPYPEDFRKVAMEVADDSLGWFFDGLVNSEGKVDYAISNVRSEGDFIIVKVKRKRKGLSVPIPISLMKSGKVQGTHWTESTSRKKWVSLRCDSCDAVILDSEGAFPDINMKDNRMLAPGPRRGRPLRPHLFAYLEDPTKRQFAYSPIIGGNKYDGFMLGLAVYNNLLPTNRFSYTLMPMYAFGSRHITGIADVRYTVFQKSGLPDVTIGLSGQRFDIGQRTDLPNNIVRPEVELFFRNENRRSNITHLFRYRSNLFISEQTGGLIRHIPQLTYILHQAFKPHSSRITADMHWFDGHTKLSLEAIYSFAFRRSRGFRARLFAGKIFRESFNPAFNFRMGGHRGYQDYLHEGAFMGRNETSGFFAQQMIEADGGFKTYMNIGASNNWLMALNLSSTLYRKIPLELFLSVGVSSNTGSAFPGSETFLVEFGASVTVIPDVLAVHFPFALSSDVQNNVELLTQNYWQRIRFTFNINEVKLRKRLQSRFN